MEPIILQHNTIFTNIFENPAGRVNFKILGDVIITTKASDLMIVRQSLKGNDFRLALNTHKPTEGQQEFYNDVEAAAEDIRDTQLGDAYCLIHEGSISDSAIQELGKKYQIRTGEETT